MKERQIVHGLWIGDSLSRMEVLTMLSFIEQGHQFNLWTYSPQLENAPAQAVIMDANLIIPKDEVFCYSNNNAFGHGKGSYAGFSDVFRYKLLSEHGGWWTDMDITCLAPLPNTPYFFRAHHSLKLVGNLMHCPKASELMRYCYTRAKAEIDSENTDWHRPIQILIDGVEQFALENHITAGVGNMDHWGETRKFVFQQTRIPSQWIFLHWQNEEWRNRGMNKNQVRFRSTLGKLFQRYRLWDREPTFKDQVINEVEYFTGLVGRNR
jgi:hypothetical protein